MKKFEERWDACMARAREEAGKDEPAPFGFATRVLSTAAARRVAEPLSVEIWQRFTIRSLPWVAIFLLICAALELPHLRERKPLDPGIENAVAQLVWSL